MGFGGRTAGKIEYFSYTAGQKSNRVVTQYTLYSTIQRIQLQGNMAIENIEYKNKVNTENHTNIYEYI